MPHDLRGQKLNPGDTVTVTFTVTEVHPGSTSCNVNLQAIRSAVYDGEYLPLLTCNSLLVTKIDSTPKADPVDEVFEQPARHERAEDSFYYIPGGA
jgi:acyl-CoA hydrolase